MFNSLAPSGTKSKVIEVAIALTISHASEKGMNAIHSIIREEKKKLLDEFSRKKQKIKSGVPLFAPKSCGLARDSLQENNTYLQSLDDLTESLRASQEWNVSVYVCDGMERLREQKTKTLKHLRHHVVGNGDAQIVANFEKCFLAMLKIFIASPLNFHILEAVIEVSDVLSLLGKLGYLESSTQELESLICDTGNMQSIINASKHAKDSDRMSYSSVGSFLFVLLDGSLVCSRALEGTLLNVVAVSEEAKFVSEAVLRNLSSDRAGLKADETGVADTTGGLVIMARLQRFLLNDTPQTQK